jgi:hypothetical protein
MGHAWGSYVPKELFREHPEYFALRGGERKAGDWYCTSNPALRKVFTAGVVQAIERGTAYPSVSPPDGTGYCECEACRKQDDPRSLEPSSGRVSVTNRYVDFLDAVARDVAKTRPEWILSFYCYADYTQPPTAARRLAPDLCAWIAPIRYCRFHRIGHPGCPSRAQLAEMLGGWAAAVHKTAYRTYNYNLAECLVPFSLLSVWKHDVPYLKSKGCIGINLESLRNWEIYGPHLYLSIRLAYSPGADADALTDDYFALFYGSKAGPPMKQYWTAIDQAFDRLACHSGSFYAMHLVYTPEFLATLKSLLDQATEAAKTDPAYAARVAMHAQGHQKAVEYVQLRDAMNAGDFARAKQVYDALFARNEAEQKKGTGNHYTLIYLKRFIGTHIEAGAAATAPPSNVLAVLPDRWRLACDPEDAGGAKGYAKAEFDDSAWRAVATYSMPLDAQGIPDEKTIQWYRTRFEAPVKAGKLTLFFTEVDGAATVTVNGAQVGGSDKKRTPFEVDITTVARSGTNVVAVRVDHSKITDLFLGGILRPVLLIQKAP